jgi:hypothetical protein
MAVLLELYTSELSHIGPGGRVLNVVGAANNVSPQCNHFLALNKLLLSSETHIGCHEICKAYTIESQRVLASRLQPGTQPGRRLRGYGCIPAQHPLDNA